MPVNSTVEPGEVTMPACRRNVEDAGQVGLEEMHHPERAEERPEAELGAGTEQRGEHGEIDDRIACEQQHVVEFRHPHPNRTSRCGRLPGGRRTDAIPVILNHVPPGWNRNLGAGLLKGEVDCGAVKKP